MASSHNGGSYHDAFWRSHIRDFGAHLHDLTNLCDLSAVFLVKQCADVAGAGLFASMVLGFLSEWPVAFGHKKQFHRRFRDDAHCRFAGHHGRLRTQLF